MRHAKDLRDRNRQNKLIAALILFAVFVSGNQLIFFMMFDLLFVCMILRTLYGGFRKREKVLLIAGYAALWIFQQAFAVAVVFDPELGLVGKWALRAVGTLTLLLPLLVERFVTANKNARFYLPSVEEVGAISFSTLEEKQERLLQLLSDVERTAKKLSPENLQAVLGDSFRHSSVSYINQGSLTEAWFREAGDSLEDPYLYIVVSDTGSAAGEIIGSVTRKVYNHASLSFDRELKTILSYNGGENLYPPGLNPELVTYFRKKPEASVLVYRLPCTREQKERVLKTVERINREGSAYNMMGLVTKQSYKPNIMFCSQFVYRMLMTADLTYFDKPAGEVRPTDFVELDYYRKLEFVREIRFR